MRSISKNNVRSLFHHWDLQPLCTTEVHNTFDNNGNMESVSFRKIGFVNNDNINWERLTLWVELDCQITTDQGLLQKNQYPNRGYVLH